MWIREKKNKNEEGKKDEKINWIKREGTIADKWFMNKT